MSDDMAAAGTADAAFGDPYDGVHGISGASWMAKAVETPLTAANGKLDKLVDAVGHLAVPAAASGGLTDADRTAIAGLTAAVNALNSRLSTP